MDLPVRYRLAKAEDEVWIKAAWRSSEYNNTAAKLSPHTLYKTDANTKINHLFHQSQTMVAYLEKESDTLLSFITYQYADDSLMIHYAFTKSPFRERGLQSNLIKLVNILHQPIVLTCQPYESILKHLQQKYNIIFDYYYFQRNFFHVQS